MTDKTRIVTKGDIAKFWLNITHADFVQADDDYQVVLSWGSSASTSPSRKRIW